MQNAASCSIRACTDRSGRYDDADSTADDDDEDDDDFVQEDGHDDDDASDVEDADRDVEPDDGEDDDDDDGGNDDDGDERGIPRTPFIASWLVPIIRPAIADAPMTSNHNLKEILKMYGNDYALTKSILQNARTMARLAIFGDGRVNAKYVLALKEELELRGHFVDILFANRTHTLNRLMLVVLAEEIQRRKAAGMKNHGLGSAARAEAFLKKWMRNNATFIDEHLGTEQQNLRFVEGIVFAPSTSRRTVPQLQSVYQADAAHLNWGKYTLYSAYGMSSEGQCSPVAFGIIFGNEDKDSWCRFWEFASSVHPSLNSATNTIITDQDKGSKAAIAAILPLVFNFHCSYHRRQNILKHCKGGTQVYKALWMFNQLVATSSMEVLNNKRDRGYRHMSAADKAYLDMVPDIEQYPAARCAMGADVQMYGRSASSGVEAMNAVNRGIRERSCVCLVNATILLMKMEADRFSRMRDSAWAHDGLLTPYGRLLADEIWKEVPNHRDYTIQKAEFELYHEFKVRGNHTGSQNQTVKVMKEVFRGHRATSCTCGVPQMTSVP